MTVYPIAPYSVYSILFSFLFVGCFFYFSKIPQIFSSEGLCFRFPSVSSSDILFNQLLLLFQVFAEIPYSQRYLWHQSSSYSSCPSSLPLLTEIPNAFNLYFFPIALLKVAYNFLSLYIFCWFASVCLSANMQTS